MRAKIKNASYIVLATFGAVVFWGGISQVQISAGPHPGLKDDALKKALRVNRQHAPLTYFKARSIVFGKLDGNGKKAECVYTGETIEYTLQPSPHIGNIEHTLPRSRMPEEANADLHHLFPVIPEANLARANFKFGDVILPVWNKGSKSGPSRSGKPVFEVRTEHRGDVARAMFYVSTMYDVRIDGDEERVLRKWHKEDPVSQKERKRNEAISKFQKSTNPFISHPGLVSRISNF